MNKASRIRLAKQLLHCARMVLYAASITADDEHSGSGYKAFKKFIFEQCPDAKNILGKYGIQDIVSTGYEIHHMNGHKTHYIQRGHSNKYYSELKKLISDNNVSEVTVSYKHNPKTTITKQQIIEEIKKVVFIPKWFHDEFTTDEELKQLSERKDVYNRMRQILLVQESYDKIKGIRCQNTIRGASNAILQLSSVAAKINPDNALNLLKNAYAYIREEVINIVKEIDSQH